MITGESPLTTFHIAELAEFADRDALILDLKEKLNITDPSQSIDESLLAKYNIRMIRAAVKQFEGKPSWKALVQHNWVLCSNSSPQKEFILTSLESLGCITLTPGNDTNDVGVSS